MFKFTKLAGEEFCILGYNAVKSVDSQLTFRRNMSPPSSGSNSKPSEIPAWSWQQAILVSCLVYSSNLKIVAIYSSEKSVDFQRTTQRYTPEDRTLRNHSCKNPVSCNMDKVQYQTRFFLQPRPLTNCSDYWHLNEKTIVVLGESERRNGVLAWELAWKDLMNPLIFGARPGAWIEDLPRYKSLNGMFIHCEMFRTREQ
jgi:hypothetical protein